MGHFAMESLLFFRWCDDDAPIGDVPLFASLQVDWSGHSFVAVEGAACNSRDFLVVDYGLAILYHGDHSPDQRDVEALPFSRLARQFG